MDALRKLRLAIFNFLDANPVWLLRYLKLAKCFSNVGLRPPLTGGTKTFLKNWVNQSLDDSCYNPNLYEKVDESTTHLFHDILPLLDTKDNILEVGCNCGRSLNYLFEKGFRNLYGIEIGQAAVDHMKVLFPETYTVSKIDVGSAPEVIKKHESKKYKLVFCHSVLVNIPAQFNYIFEEMARVSERYIVTIESEASWKSYPRDFKKKFENVGFKEISYKYLVPGDKPGSMNLPKDWLPETQLENNILRVFVRE